MDGTFRVFLVVTCCITLLCGCGARNNVYLEENGQEEEQAASELTEEDTLVPSSEEAVSMCYVYVCGAVVSPGVYALPENSRIFEAVASAGGMTGDAAEDAVNQAAFVTDGQMLRIPTVEEAEMLPVEQAAEGSTGDGLLDINRATVAELMTLPGIGQSKAESIVAYRDANGAFSAIEDLMKVDGIKDGVFNKIKNSIKVN